MLTNWSWTSKDTISQVTSCRTFLLPCILRELHQWDLNFRDLLPTHPYPVLSAGFRNPHLNGSKEPGTASSCCCCKMGSTPGLGTKLGQSRRLLVSSIMIADPQNHTSLLYKSSLLLSNRPCHKHTSALETGFQVCSSALFFSVLNTTFALLFPTLELTLDNLFT